MLAFPPPFLGLDLKESLDLEESLDMACPLAGKRVVALDNGERVGHIAIMVLDVLVCEVRRVVGDDARRKKDTYNLY